MQYIYKGQEYTDYPIGISLCHPEREEQRISTKSMLSHAVDVAVFAGLKHLSYYWELEE